MIANESKIISGESPDSQYITKKLPIDISLNTFDISASGYNTSSDIRLSNDNTEIKIIDDAESDNFDKYFTPIYSEKINYTVWKTTIQKNFTELTLEG